MYLLSLKHYYLQIMYVEMSQPQHSNIGISHAQQFRIKNSPRCVAKPFRIRLVRGIINKMVLFITEEALLPFIFNGGLGGQNR